MSDDDQQASETVEPPSEDEQKQIGLEWFSAMWEEALARGVTPHTLTTVCLTMTLNRLVALYGEPGAAQLMAELPESILNGRFSVTFGDDSSRP